MKRIPNALALAALVCLAGCDTTGVTDTAAVAYATVTPELAAAGASVSVGAPGAGMKSVGKVEATGCQKTHYDPQPDEAFTLALLKQQAAVKGATILANVAYHHYNVSLSANCYTTIVADGVAWK